eukprot:77126-Rhodomonas_salina.4
MRSSIAEIAVSATSGTGIACGALPGGRRLQSPHNTSVPPPVGDTAAGSSIIVYGQYRTPQAILVTHIAVLLASGTGTGPSTGVLGGSTVPVEPSLARLTTRLLVQSRPRNSVPHHQTPTCYAARDTVLGYHATVPLRHCARLWCDTLTTRCAGVC